MSGKGTKPVQQPYEDAEDAADTDNTCVVCFKNAEIFSVGVCDHPVCFECSTRMRVLCKQNECPICRQDMPKVIFSREIKPFATLKIKLERTNLQDRRFGIHFATQGIQKGYNRLLEHSCSLCDSKDPYEKRWPFRTFQQLKEHMRREHELFYCDLCSDNLKIFSFERRCYTRQELAQHRRKGDSDNTSHRGHPLCEFCDTRYVDSDELFRHLRRDHLYCHFCDADGKHEYYSTYDDLRNHFLEEHYLCEEGECKNEKFTSVFRSDIDLKAHIASVHSRNLSKAATRQARTLELEFTLAPRARADALRNQRRPQNRNHEREEELLGAIGFDYPEPGGGGSGNAERTFVNSLSQDNFPSLGNQTSSSQPRPVSNMSFMKPVRSFGQDDFPSLGGSGASSASASGRPHSMVLTTSSRGNALKKEDFPQLGGSSGGGGGMAASASSFRAPEVTITRSSRPQHNKNNAKDFPALGEPSTSGTSTLRFSMNSNSQDRQNVPNVSIQVKHKSNGAITTSIRASSSQQKHTEAFPALNADTTPPEPQWVQLKPKKSEPRTTNKVAEAPVLPPPSSEFPSLCAPKKNDKKKSSSVTVPVVNNSNNNNKASTKNNTKKPEENVESKTKNKKKKANKTTSSASSSSNSVVTNETEKKLEEPQEKLQNGLVKKRSELKIGNLESGDATDTSGLGAPPGFPQRPPPGFAQRNSALANDLTFTNSTGRSYSIRPITKYIQPEDFAKRNRDLIEKCMSMLNNGEAIREFRNYSNLFRSGTLPARIFYDHCKIVLGEKFSEVFPELLVLLPDIEKQQELYKVHMDVRKEENLMVCESCKQIVFKKEVKHHNSYHNLDDFPPLR